jgi:hypothetical protein
MNEFCIAPEGYELVQDMDSRVSPGHMWTYDNVNWHKISLMWLGMQMKTLKCVTGICQPVGY